MVKVYVSLIRKGLMSLNDIKNESMKEEVQRILEEK